MSKLVISKYNIARSAKSGNVTVLFKEKSTGKDRMLIGTLFGASKRNQKLATATRNVVRMMDTEDGMAWKSVNVKTVKFFQRTDANPTCIHRR